MTSPNEPLAYSPDFPPTDKWKKFFIGVRWLGPDLSFFGNLRQQQGARTGDVMAEWANPTHRELTEFLGQQFKAWLRWPTPYFIPADPWAVNAGGPRFEAVDYLEFESAVDEIHKHVGKRFSEDFWRAMWDKSLGEVVGALADIRDRA